CSNSCPSSSSVLPFVSGKYFHTVMACSSIITAKKAKACAPPYVVFSTTAGNRKVISAAKNQCVKEPSDCPLPRTLPANTSDISTQMTAPVEKAKNMMYPINKYRSWYPPNCWM